VGTPAANIRALAGMHSITQSELADAIGVSRQAVKGWLSGATPSARHAYALAQLFGIPNSDLLLWGDIADVLVAGARVYHDAPATKLSRQHLNVAHLPVR
jgi:transcriptional regulator with XRE-family HTH domain